MATTNKVKTKTAAPKKRAAPKKKKAAPKKQAAVVKRTGASARAKAVKKILLNVEKKMKAEAIKATLGDYIKLLQLSKEMTGETRTDITVTWIEEPDRLIEK